MAIKVNVPGVGDIEIQGAAEEATMQKILAAVSKTSKTGTDNAKKTEEAQKKFIKQTEEAEEALTGFAKAEREAEAEARKSAMSQRVASAEFARGLGNFAKNLTLSAANLTLGFAKAHESIASDPIGAGAAIINTGIDLVAQGSKVITKGLGSIAEGIPVIGGIVKGASEAAQAAIDLAAAAAKMANDFLSAELKKTAGALKDLSAQGASFAGGMTELRNTANGAGMNLVMFTGVMKASKESILAMGLTSTQAAQVLGTNLKGLATTAGKSGMSLRNEMLAMGYSYEEQGAIMSQYMAQQKASGQLEKMTREDISKGTREYAKNLKVLSDITGEDAKKLMEKARQESMRGALASRLQGDQQTAFKDAYATLSSFGPEVQEALVQQLTGGAVTNPVVAGNAKLMALIESTAAGVQAGNKGMIASTQSAMAETAKATRESADSNLDDVKVMSRGTATMASGMADLENKMRAYQLDPGAAEQTAVATEKQAVAADGATKGFVQATEAATNFSIKVEELATQALPSYANILAKSLQAMVDMLRKAGINIAETAEEATARKAKEAEEAAAKAKSEEMRRQQGVNYDLTNEMGMDFGQLSGSGGGIFSGPDSGFPVLLHGTEAVIPMDQLTGAKKQGPVNIKDPDQVGPTAFGINEYLGINMGPMSTNLDTIKQISEKIGAFDSSTQTITNPEVWKKIMGFGLEYQLGEKTLGGAAQFGPEFGSLVGEAIKEAMSGSSGMPLDQAIKEAFATYQQAATEQLQQMQKALEEGNDISSRLLNASY